MRSARKQSDYWVIEGKTGNRITQESLASSLKQCGSEPLSGQRKQEQQCLPFPGLLVSPPTPTVPLDCREHRSPARHACWPSKRHKDPEHAQETRKEEAVPLDCRKLHARQGSSTNTHCYVVSP